MGIRLFIALLLAVTMITGSAGSAAPRYRVQYDRIAKGVYLRRILDRRGPNRIRVLTIDPRKAVTLDVALGTEELPGHEQTTSMARRHGAIAAINGDFTLLPGSAGSGRPVNTFIEDGALKASPLIWGRNFSISRDERRARVGHTGLRTWLVHSDGQRWKIDAVNPVEPDRDAFTIYTPTGASAIQPPRDSCSARLLPAGPRHWNQEQDGVSRDFVVDQVVCRYRRLQRGAGYVVSAGRATLSGVVLEDTLVEGEVVTFGWAFNRPGVVDTIGGNPNLLSRGRITVGGCTGSYFCDRNPRTGIGITPDRKILMVTVDGRSRSSVGMTLRGFAQLFQYLGASSAMNMDGGGSTTMVVRGRIVNVPSGGYERPVGSALLVLPGTDEEEREPLPFVAPTPTPTPSPLPTKPAATPTRSSTPTHTAAPSPSTSSTSAPAPRTMWLDGVQGITEPSCQVLLDPASTGGMLDALAKGAIGADRPLARQLKWALRVYRGDTFCG